MRDPIITEKSVLTKLSSDKSSEVISPNEQIPIREITFIKIFPKKAKGYFHTPL